MRRFFVMEIFNFANRCKIWTPKSSKVNLDHKTERCLLNHDYQMFLDTREDSMIWDIL